MLTLSQSGGVETIISAASEDATQAFEDVKHSDEALDILTRLETGTISQAVSRRTKQTLGPFSF